MERRSSEEDRSAVGQTQSWRAEDKREVGDTLYAGGGGVKRQMG